MLISTIIKENKLTLEEKQLGIENVILNYDLDWFKNEIENSVDIKSIILHDIYTKLDKELSVILQPYIKNKFENLIINIDNPLKRSECIAVLIIILLGNDRIINICFKLLIELVSQYNNDKLFNRTDILFKIVDRLSKYYFIYLKSLIKEEKNKILI